MSAGENSSAAPESGTGLADRGHQQVIGVAVEIPQREAGHRGPTSTRCGFRPADAIEAGLACRVRPRTGSRAVLMTVPALSLTRRCSVRARSSTSSKKISATPFVKSSGFTVANPPMTTESMLHSTAMAAADRERGRVRLRLRHHLPMCGTSAHPDSCQCRTPSRSGWSGRRSTRSPSACARRAPACRHARRAKSVRPEQEIPHARHHSRVPGVARASPARDASRSLAANNPRRDPAQS